LTVYADLLVSLHAAEDQARLALLLPELAAKAGADRHRRLCPNRPAHPRGAGARCPGGVRGSDLRRQQGAAIEQAMTRFGQGAAACILTKLDETPQPGAALDSLIRHRLPLAYISGGQRVPEDLHAPNASYLIDRALKGGQLATPYALEAEDWPLFAGVEAERAERRTLTGTSTLTGINTQKGTSAG
jgi:flagellar biosynthesis protein FlhF